MRDKSGAWEYDSAVDVNQRDATGQTLLYLATCIGNQKIMDLLLAHKVRARKKDNDNKDEKERPSQERVIKRDFPDY